MTLQTAKAVEVLFENALETYETQTQMLDMVEVFRPDPAKYQDSSNIIWRPVQQHAPVKEGWTINDSGQAAPNFGDVIEEYYPATLEEPKNDAFTLRADDLRDIRFWERRGEQSGRRQASFLNKRIADLVIQQGSLFYRSNAVNGYDFVGEAQTILNERQVYSPVRSFILNERDRQVYAADLAERGTLSGRPEESYATGMIGREVAQFDVYSGSYLGNLAGGASPDTTVTGNQSFAPVGQTTGATPVNVDYRSAIIPVADSSGYNVGDKVTFANTGDPTIKAIGLDDKTVTGSNMTFSIVSLPNATSIEVFPKPIALDDPALTAEQAAVANVNTRILDGATVQRGNIDDSARANVFWAKDSIEIVGGDAPITLLNEFGGQKVISSSLKSGLTMYMAYDGNINDLTFKCRIFTWWGLVNRNPMANGVAVRA
ncbi:hypothetical protein AB832_08135 [Flavobacteriaceae bacterium (ex Bugula neritina AB1)]|nr:hypothetical protein AB832_08135 [Flavobacteriaceae bacterium (ex Bugula neritina AB1)]